MYQSVEPPLEPVPMFCPQCGKQVKPAAKFCGSCGKALAGASVKPTASPVAPPPYTPPQHSFPAQPPVYTPPQPPPLPASPAYSHSPGQYTPPSPPTQLYPQTPPGVVWQPAQAMPYSAKAVRVNLSQAMRFPFDANNWFVNMLIGGFTIFIPVVGWLALNGYAIEITRRVINDENDVLPDWDDFGTKLQDGLAILGLTSIWALLPVFILGLPGFLISAAGAEDAGAVVAFVGVVLANLLTYFFLPAVWGRYASSNSFVAGLQAVQMWEQIRANLGRYTGNWLLAGFMLLVSFTIVAIIGSISGATMIFLIGFCGLPFVFMAGFYGSLIQAHLIGQLYRIIR
jgi:hypothetical protein